MLITRYYCDETKEEDKMGWAFSTDRKLRKAQTFFRST
jgi:hypothetical protein